MRLIADEPLYEVVDGQRVEIAPMGIHETLIASALLWFLQTFARPHRLGRAVVEALFDLGPAGRERRPDVAFVSSQRWPYHRPPPRGDNAWKVIPNLAVEVVRPSNTADETLIKIHEYFRAGVELVWVVYPDPGEVYVYESPSIVHILKRTDVLDGGKVLPGFQLALAELFEDGPVADEKGSLDKHGVDSLTRRRTAISSFRPGVIYRYTMARYGGNSLATGLLPLVA